MARTPWRIHLWAWDLAERCFSSLCEMVKKFELKKFELKKNWIKKNLKKIFFRSEHMSSPIWCFLKFPLCWGGGSKNQSWSEWRETWSRFGIFEIRWNFEIWSEKLTGQQASKHTSGHHSDQISRSALRDGATKNTFNALFTRNIKRSKVPLTKTVTVMASVNKAHKKVLLLNARGIPTAAYQVLHLLPEVGYMPIPRPGLTRGGYPRWYPPSQVWPGGWGWGGYPRWGSPQQRYPQPGLPGLPRWGTPAGEPPRPPRPGLMWGGGDLRSGNPPPAGPGWGTPSPAGVPPLPPTGVDYVRGR